MALNSYMTVEGERQGKIDGSAAESGREGSMVVVGWNHEILSPRDAATGLPTGKRQHRPLTVTKEVDKASPLLMQALVTNENLPSVMLSVTQRVDGSEQEYTVELVNATISSIRTEQLNNKYPENMPHETREHVSFTYERIRWEWVADGLSASDAWPVER